MSFEALHDLSLLSPCEGTCLWSLAEHWTASRVSSPSPSGSKKLICLEEVIGEWVRLLSFEHDSPHINKIYNDQTAFLKIDDPQSLCHCPANSIPAVFRACFNMLSVEDSYNLYVRCSLTGSQVATVAMLHIGPSRQLAYMSYNHDT